MCRRVNEVLLLHSGPSLLSWFLALDNGCSAMNSSLKATVLEYIYKWTEKGWDMAQAMSCIYHLRDRHKTSFVKTFVPRRAEAISYMVHIYDWHACRFIGLFIQEFTYYHIAILQEKTQNQCCQLFLWYTFSCYYLDDSKMK